MAAVAGYWPSQCDRHALKQIKSIDSTQNTARWKTQPPPDSRLLPLCHFITSGLPSNKLECRKFVEPKPRPLLLAVLYVGWQSH